MSVAVDIRRCLLRLFEVYAPDNSFEVFDGLAEAELSATGAFVAVGDVSGEFEPDGLGADRTDTLRGSWNVDLWLGSGSHWDHRMEAYDVVARLETVVFEATATHPRLGLSQVLWCRPGAAAVPEPEEPNSAGANVIVVLSLSVRTRGVKRVDETLPPHSPFAG